MNIRYIVLDEAGHRTLDDSGEPETFQTFDGAANRARRIAGENGGKFIEVHQLAAEVIAPVGKVEIRTADQPEPECDCQCPEPQSGVAGISESCPIHN